MLRGVLVSLIFVVLKMYIKLVQREHQHVQHLFNHETYYGLVLLSPLIKFDSPTRRPLIPWLRTRIGELVRWLSSSEHWLLFQRSWVQVLTTTWWLKTTWNGIWSSLRLSEDRALIYIIDLKKEGEEDGEEGRGEKRKKKEKKKWVSKHAAEWPVGVRIIPTSLINQNTNFLIQREIHRLRLFLSKSSKK